MQLYEEEVTKHHIILILIVIILISDTQKKVTFINIKHDENMVYGRGQG